MMMTLEIVYLAIEAGWGNEYMRFSFLLYSLLRLLLVSFRLDQSRSNHLSASFNTRSITRRIVASELSVLNTRKAERN